MSNLAGFSIMEAKCASLLSKVKDFFACLLMWEEIKEYEKSLLIAVILVV